MKRENKRTLVSAGVIRKAWQAAAGSENVPKLGRRVIENIEDDSDDLRLCWCCGKQGYQERCHIVPHSLGGLDTPANLFLLCSACHVLSPDTLSPDWFFRWISEEAERHEDLDRAFFASVVSELSDALMNTDPCTWQGKAQDTFFANYKTAKSNVSAHGGDVSKATRYGAVTAAVRQTIRDIGDGKLLQQG